MEISLWSGSSSWARRCRRRGRHLFAPSESIFGSTWYQKYAYLPLVGKALGIYWYFGTIWPRARDNVSPPSHSELFLSGWESSVSRWLYIPWDHSADSADSENTTSYLLRLLSLWSLLFFKEGEIEELLQDKTRSFFNKKSFTEMLYVFFFSYKFFFRNLFLPCRRVVVRYVVCGVT